MNNGRPPGRRLKGSTQATLWSLCNISIFVEERTHSLLSSMQNDGIMLLCRATIVLVRWCSSLKLCYIYKRVLTFPCLQTYLHLWTRTRTNHSQYCTHPNSFPDIALSITMDCFTVSNAPELVVLSDSDIVQALRNPRNIACDESLATYPLNYEHGSNTGHFFCVIAWYHCGDPECLRTIFAPPVSIFGPLVLTSCSQFSTHGSRVQTLLVYLLNVALGNEEP